MLEHYILQALRGFGRFKVTAAVNLIGLTLALVCFVVTHLFVAGLLSTDEHFPKSQRTYVITEDLWTSPTQRMIPPFPQGPGVAVRYLRSDFPALEAVGRAQPLSLVSVSAGGERKLNLYAAAVDPEFLQIFDFPFLQGSAHNALAATNDVVITAQGAERLFGTANAVGRHLRFNGHYDLTVTGVLGTWPRPSHMGTHELAVLRFDLLVPTELQRRMMIDAGLGQVADPDAPSWGNDNVNIYVLLPANGTLTPRELVAGLKSFGERHVPKDQLIAHFGAVPVSRIYLQNLEAIFGGGAHSVTTSLYLLDALILAIACLNYANLSVAIASTRAREIGMRRVLGAGQTHLMRQYLVETFLVGVAALVLVLTGAVLALPLLSRALGIDLPLSLLLQPQLWLLVVGMLAAVVLVGGGYPALVLSRLRPADALRAGTVRAGPRFVSTLLVGVQFAAASFLLLATLLMLGENRELQRVGLRADRDPVVVIENNVLQLGVPNDTLRAELLRDPHVVSVAGTLNTPWNNGGAHLLLQRGREASSTGQLTLLNNVSVDFFATIGLRPLAGRVFEREHHDEFFLGPARPDGAPDNIVIDLSLSRQLGWPRPADAVGRVVYDFEGNPHGNPRPMRVIGVVEDGYPRLVGPNTSSNLYVLFPEKYLVPIIRVARDGVQPALAHIDAVWNRLQPDTALRREFMDDLFNRAYVTFAVMSDALSGLAVFAFVIAIMGLFGMAVHVTNRRRREIGIRKTLGARVRDIVLMLLRDFSKPVVIANIIAWPVAFVLERVYLNLFTTRVAISAWPFVASFVITLGIAWIAVAEQARRAAAVKPVQVLQEE